MQSSHHKISFLNFPNFKKTPNICQYISFVNHNIKFQQPPWTRNNGNIIFIPYLTYLLPECNPPIIKSVFWNFPNFQKNSKYASIH